MKDNLHFCSHSDGPQIRVSLSFEKEPVGFLEFTANPKKVGEKASLPVMSDSLVEGFQSFSLSLFLFSD